MDLKGFEHLYKTHQPSLVNFAFFYLKHHQDAIDTVQELFITLWEKRDTLEISNNPKAYLMTAVRNRCINALTRKKIQFPLSEFLEEILIDAQTPLASLESKQTEQSLHRAIAVLPDKCREIFVLSRFERMSYKEIATFLGLSTKTVESQISNALKMLRKHNLILYIGLASASQIF